MNLDTVHRVLHSDQDNTRDMQEHQCKKRTVAKHVACMEEIRNIYNISAGKHEGKRPFGSCRAR
jgi:hypothetical protein